MELPEGCSGPHLILDVWDPGQLPGEGDSPDVCMAGTGSSLKVLSCGTLKNPGHQSAGKQSRGGGRGAAGPCQRGFLWLGCGLGLFSKGHGES